ncbi:type II secretion system F family protein [Rheinheimera baltica]|uniref:type II secretion system F family protein n=1 Tax=Rheinheimera baltica TaxID=67576 RepID=UPI00273EF373|nr:type II secretion system F family protein [Rheinheimera baltica]MDP5142598.1 type II secretion system F family protein [Rheinheimera baltica]MDP5151907.1 type II secretion system F family protein [Rheinheimera baltica]
MAQFVYTARDSAGKAVSGEIEAGNESAAADILRRRSVIPLTISRQDTPAKTSLMGPVLWQRKISLTDLIMLSRQMYSLMRAGIPIIRAIEGLAQSTSSVRLQGILLELVDQLQNGRNLSQALAAHPKVFSRLMVSIVHVGENTGRLDEAFLQLTYYFEQELETRKQIKQATRYPIFVLLTLVVAMFILNLAVIPQFASMFARFNAELPWSTKALLASSEFFIRFWPLMLIGFIAAVFGLRSYIQTDKGRRAWGRWKIRSPIIGSIIYRATLGRFARSFGMMLKAGVPMTSALTLVADAVDNDFLGDSIRDMRRNIERGESLLRVSQQSQMFTPLVLQMLAVGEETGAMDDMLAEVAGFYEREVAFDLKSLTAKIEPILISIVAVMVLILALGIFTPMWDMLNAYKGGTK